MPRHRDRKPVFAPHGLEPWFVDGELAGLCAGGARLPFPGCGLETELGVVVHGAGGQVQPVLGDLLARRTGVVARAAAGSDSSLEAERQFDTLGSSYREGDHLELNTWYWRSGIPARWNLERLLIRAGELAQQDGERILLYATGGDGQHSTWSSLHVNVGISDLGYERLAANYRACRVALDWYLPAQISLTVIDGNGGVGRDGFLLSDRLAEFDAVFGAGTMRPSRAMLVDRPEGFGNRRIMNMLRTLSFGRASCAGLVATQLDCLASDLMVHDLLRAPPTRLPDPVAAAAELAPWEQRHHLARLQQRAQRVRWCVVDGLARALGDELAERLVPGARAELEFIDATLQAVLRDDEAELLQRCDWARKRRLMVDHAGAAGGAAWSARLPELLELNIHYARLDDRALRHVWPAAAMPPTHRPDPVPADTSSWLLHWVCARAEQEPSFRAQLADVDLSWKGLSRRIGGWIEPQGGAWPWAERRCQAIAFEPWRFTRGATAARLAAVGDVDDLFLAFGREHAHSGDYAGRSYGPSAGGPASPNPWN
jgi:hypothetical protein